MFLYGPSTVAVLLPAAFPLNQFFEVFCVSLRRLSVGTLHLAL